MALIKCPECQKEISDKSSTCIHCGYPLIQLNNISICEIDGKKYELPTVKKLLDLNKATKENLAEAITQDIIAATGTWKFKIFFDQEFAEKILKDGQIPQKYNSGTIRQSTQVSCPRCGSTAITTGARGVNWTLGLIGASKTVNRCAKCGHTWTPHK